MIDEQLSKLLDSYIARVEDSDDKILFSEAIAAAKASALRAAHMTLWLGCIESLKRKFRELAGRDSSIGRILGEVAALDEAKRYVDGYVLEQAKAYGLLSTIELAKLVHIHAMDSIYRCPYEKKPSIEEFIADASVIVDSVLCRPTRLQPSSTSERAHLLSQQVQSLSRALDKCLVGQKRSTSTQQTTTPDKTQTVQMAASGQPKTTPPTALKAEPAESSTKQEAHLTEKSDPQTTSPQAKSEPSKRTDPR